MRKKRPPRRRERGCVNAAPADACTVRATSPRSPVASCAMKEQLNYAYRPHSRRSVSGRASPGPGRGRRARPGFPGRSDGQITQHLARNERRRHFTSAFVRDAAFNPIRYLSHFPVNQEAEKLGCAVSKQSYLASPQFLALWSLTFSSFVVDVGLSLFSQKLLLELHSSALSSCPLPDVVHGVAAARVLLGG